MAANLKYYFIFEHLYSVKYRNVLNKILLFLTQIIITQLCTLLYEDNHYRFASELIFRTEKYTH